MLRKHSVNINGHNTSFSLEDEFYQELILIAKRKRKPLSRLITELDDNRDPARNLSSVLRVYILEELKSALK